MPENTNQKSNAASEKSVDGFTDSQNQKNAPDIPDYGTQGRKEPLTEEERMAAEREINEKGDRNRLSEKRSHE
ncbi:MAG TPA: hypothetical protein VGE01_05540 [Fimbriimonas sp.]